ncbi:MAG: HAD family hydrolase [Desulfovermiculus sp.]|nr:HAD family hydrolase [Desulfovermiculus sp.]
MGAIQGVLFDFDGTLAELHIDFQAMRKQVADLAALFLDQYVEPDSRPVLEWIGELAELMSRELSQAEVLEFQSRCRMRLVGLEMKAAQKGKLFAYTPGVLSGLREKGVRTAVVTRNCTAAVKTVYPQLVRDVDCLLARDDVDRVKPDPEHLFRAASVLGLGRQACLMVGDHWLDIVAAQKAGMYSAAVHTGKVEAAVLASYGPDFAAPDVHSLIQELGRFGLLAGGQSRSRIDWSVLSV